jgi:hypothetical protein
MRNMLLAAAAALTLGTAAAHADGGGYATTRFTIIQDELAGQMKPAPVPQQAAKDQPSDVRTNTTRSGNLGTWLYPPSTQSEGGAN